MFDDILLFIVTLLLILFVIGLNILINYYFYKFRLSRNPKASRPIGLKTSKETMNVIIIIDTLILIISALFMVFDSRIFMPLLILIYLITIFPAMSRVYQQAKIDFEKERYH